MLSDEFEAINGKLVTGDVTAVAIEMFRDCKHMDDLLRYVTLCRSTDLQSKLLNMSEHKVKQVKEETKDESVTEMSIEDWAMKFGTDMSL